MNVVLHSPLTTMRRGAAPAVIFALTAVLSACASSSSSMAGGTPSPKMSMAAPSPDPRVGLKGGMYDAGEALWNMKLVSTTKPSGKFVGSTNSDIAFTGNYVIQGNYNGYQIWDISNPAAPTLKFGNYCPASQSDVSTYQNLLFVSAEGNTGRIDCGDQGVKDPISKDRIKGVRIFDISDISKPKNVANIQTCRGSHTHTVLVDPKDKENIYIYVSGSAPVRPGEELPGCSAASPDKDQNSALFRIEVIKVPLAHPEQAAIVSSPRIFNDLIAPPSHGETPGDIAEGKKAAAEARAKGGYTAMIFGAERVLPPQMVKPMIDSVAKANGHTVATGSDSAIVRSGVQAVVDKMVGASAPKPGAVRPGPTQCHDITVYPGVGLAGGACEGYGLLLDIRDPAHPVRIAAAADSNFSYWHSATFNNDGTKLLFSDEWGGGGAPKCRATDPKEWGADALFNIVNGKLEFQGYYKLPAAQTSFENCVAHNGSLIPIPGRDVMVQAFYQGGLTVFDWTDPKHAKEIAFFDRGPVDPTRFTMGGSWSVYWYNGVMVSSEIARGLDIVELTPSAMISQNEIDAAKSVKYEYLNAQGQPKMVWPATFSLAKAYADQLERSGGLSSSRLGAVRSGIAGAEAASGSARRDALMKLASTIDGDAASSKDAAKVRMMASAVRDLATK
jgi:hypothetical protein